MKLRLLLALCLSAIFVSACSDKSEIISEHDKPAMEKIKVKIRATLGSGVKTSLSPDDKVLWSVGDEISIFYNDINYKFVSTNTEPSETAVFEGWIDVPTEESGVNYIDWLSDPVYGVYPYSTSNSIKNGAIKVELPSLQQAVEGSFADDLSISAGVSNGFSMAFRNVCGLVEFTVAEDNIVKVTLKGNGTNSPEAISGNMSITFGKDGYPSASLASGAGTEISIAKPNGEPLIEGERYYMVVPPLTFAQGLTFKFVTTQDDILENVITTPVELGRSAIKSFYDVDKDAVDSYNIIFEDEVFRSYCLANFDANNDGQISKTEAKAATEINMNNENHPSSSDKIVKSLAGIEYFVNIEKLICSNASGAFESLTVPTALSQLDLTKNTKLRYIDLGCQPSLRSINVSACTELASLDVYGYYSRKENGQKKKYSALQGIDVSSNIKLSNLVCTGIVNETSLDLSNHAQLSTIDVSYSNITALQLNEAAPLVDIGVSGNSQLTNISVDKYAGLENLYTDCTGIRAMDLSKNPNIRSLTVTSLKGMGVPAGGFQSLDYLGINSGDTPEDVEITHIWGDPNIHQLSRLSIQGFKSLKFKSLVASNLYLSTSVCDSLVLPNNVIIRTIQYAGSKMQTLDVSAVNGLGTIKTYGTNLNKLIISAGQQLFVEKDTETEIVVKQEGIATEPFTRN